MFKFSKEKLNLKDLILKNPSITDLVILTIFSLFIRFQYVYMIYKPGIGYPLTRDGYWYIDAAKELLQSFHIEKDLNGIFYISYYGVLAVVLFIFKSATVMVLLQALVGAISVILVYRISEMAFNRRVAILASALYILSKDLKFWSVYILTDSLFVSALLLSVFLLMKYYKEREKRYLFIFIGSLVYMALLRPAGTVTIAFIMVYFVLSFDYSKLIGFVKKHYIISSLITVAAIPAVIFTAVKVLSSSLGMSFYWNLKWLLYGNYSAGQVFDIPTPYDHKYNAVKAANYLDNNFLSFLINNWYHIMIIYIKRFISFYGELWVWHYRFKNAAEAFDYFMRLIPILLMFFGMLRAVYNKLLDKVFILYVPIVSTVLFCVLFFLDSGWRYRIPSIPFNGIFLAYGVDFIIEALIKFYKKLQFKKKVAKAD